MRAGTHVAARASTACPSVRRAGTVRQTRSMWHLGRVRLDGRCHMGLTPGRRSVLSIMPADMSSNRWIAAAVCGTLLRRPQENVDGALSDLPAVLNAFLHGAPEMNPDKNP